MQGQSWGLGARPRLPPASFSTRRSPWPRLTPASRSRSRKEPVGNTECPHQRQLFPERRAGWGVSELITPL